MSEKILIPLVPRLGDYDTKKRREEYLADMERLGEDVTPWEPYFLKVNLDYNDPHYHLALHMYSDSGLLLTMDQLGIINTIANAHGCEFYVDQDAVEGVRRLLGGR
jgi:hypothetical protein